MDAQTTNQTFDLLPLCGPLKRSGRYHVGPCPFCGGRDRFTLKHTSEGDRWHCRKCGDGRYHTPIDFIMRLKKCDFDAALTSMDPLGTPEHGGSTAAHAASSSGLRPWPPGLPTPSWQADARRFADAACLRLGAAKGRAGLKYLTGARRLHPSVLLAWDIGFTPVMQFCDKDTAAFGGPTWARPAVVLPWHDGGTITQVKYRIIGANRDKLRTNKQPAVDALLFGLQHLLGSDRTLLLVEGEINALSVWQCHPQGVAVVSFGSEGGGRPDALRALAARYERTFVWCDDLRRARAISAQVPRARALRSPQHRGVKYDANQLLQAGALGGLLTHIFAVPCLGQTRSGTMARGC
jgi:hypothetical protein